MSFTKILLFCSTTGNILTILLIKLNRTILKKSALLIAASVLFATGTFAQSANDIIGEWKAEDDSSKLVEIYLAKDAFYYGKANNPKQTGYGKVMMSKLQYDSSNRIYKGTMTPLDMDMTLNVTIRFLTKTKLKIVAKKVIVSKTFYLIQTN